MLVRKFVSHSIAQNAGPEQVRSAPKDFVLLEPLDVHLEKIRARDDAVPQQRVELAHGDRAGLQVEPGTLIERAVGGIARACR